MYINATSALYNKEHGKKTNDNEDIIITNQNKIMKAAGKTYILPPIVNMSKIELICYWKAIYYKQRRKTGKVVRKSKRRKIVSNRSVLYASVFFLYRVKVNIHTKYIYVYCIPVI